MSKIVSIATATPKYKHTQQQLLAFMQQAYNQNENENRKLSYLFKKAGIETRYSVLPDFGLPQKEWTFYPSNKEMLPFPDTKKRMEYYNLHASKLAVETINSCIENHISKDEITHLITVSCTGISAPGLDLHILEAMQLNMNTSRTSINFMGCYAAIHALKQANGIIAVEPNANVVIVCLEYCTLHFQKEFTTDNITAGTLFADGCATVLVQHATSNTKGLLIDSFYSEVKLNGKQHMAWQISSTGFVMTLSSYISKLLEEDFETLLNNALHKSNLQKSEIDYWCIHPGGKTILEAVERSLQLQKNDLQFSYNVLKNFGNMSSSTILFVLKNIMAQAIQDNKPANIFGAAFGPGLTMETFIVSYA